MLIKDLEGNPKVLYAEDLNQELTQLRAANAKLDREIERLRERLVDIAEASKGEYPSEWRGIMDFLALSAQPKEEGE